MRSLSSLWLMLLFSTAAVASAPKTEKDKINYLLSAIGSSDCTFIRNGMEHSATAAQEHLQDKLKAAEGKGKVNTAEDFITVLASKSFQTGKPYLIKTKDGKTVELAAWLREKLKQMPSP